jgi:hypothetical protein
MFLNLSSRRAKKPKEIASNVEESSDSWNFPQTELPSIATEVAQY